MGSTTRYLVAFVLPLLVAVILTPLAARLSRGLGLVAKPRSDRFHDRATPYLGGLAIAGGLVIIGAIAGGARGQLLVIVLGGLALAGVGLIDDIRGLSPWVRVVAEASAGAALWIAGVRVGLTGITPIDFALTVAWVIAATNAMNLLDNADGVSASVTSIAAVGVFAVAALEGQYLVGSLALALAGATTGFLIYNLPPAKVFMGDAGALMLGFLLAALALKLEVNGAGPIARSTAAVFALGVPLFDALLVVTHRLREGAPVHRGGTDHTAHRLSASGLSARAIVGLFVIAQIICSAAAFAIAQAGEVTALILAFVAAVAAFILLRLLLRLEPPANPNLTGIAPVPE